MIDVLMCGTAVRDENGWRTVNTYLRRLMFYDMHVQITMPLMYATSNLYGLKITAKSAKRVASPSHVHN